VSCGIAGGDGTELLELVPGVEGTRPAATAAGAEVVFLLFFDRDDRLDAAVASAG